MIFMYAHTLMNDFFYELDKMQKGKNGMSTKIERNKLKDFMGNDIFMRTKRIERTTSKEEVKAIKIGN